MRVNLVPDMHSGLPQDRASDDKHAERAARQFDQQKADMLNAKKYVLREQSVAAD